MKRAICLMLGCLCLMTSCAQTPADATSSQVLSTIPDVIPYEDTFEEFMMFPQGRGYFYGKKKLEKREVEGMPFVLFRVMGIADVEAESIIYTVRIEQIYGVEHYDRTRLYHMVWRGLPEIQLYGRPPLEIGALYGRFLGVTEESLESMALWQAGLVFRAELSPSGCYELYGYGVDISALDCRLEITDPEENAVYKAGRHDKAIAALTALGQPLPVFEYKAEAEAFYREISG
ncbi:MAG: hypothetical protein IJV98_00975 [Clostridia bacterium]|nr:hypothetical protein [Clostridia bacterium]